jgi:DNA modification methylase
MNVNIEFNKMSVTALHKYCKKNNIKGYSGKPKSKLIEMCMKEAEMPDLEIVEMPNLEIEIENTELLDLIEDNAIVLKKIFDENLFEVIKAKYKYSDNKEENIYNFIGAYRDTIKQQYNINMGFTDYTLYHKAIENSKIKIVWGNCLDLLQKLPNESIGHMVTSPPYYNARDYSTWENLQKYLDDMRKIILECYRVLDNHRVFVFNVSDIVDNDKMDKINAFGKRKIPLASYFINIFEECGFTYIDDIIWDKGEVQSSRHKNGNKPYPFFQYPCNCYEHILIFHKHRLEKDIKYPCNQCGSLEVKTNSYTSRGLRSWECKNTKCSKSESNRGKRFSLKTIITQNPILQQNNIIQKELIADWRRDIHKLSPVIKINNKKENKLGHTAPFPTSIPEMSIQYYSYKGDTVLDMFAGSFTVAIMAKKLGRIGIGFELRKDLFRDCIIKHIKSNECDYEELN